MPGHCCVKRLLSGCRDSERERPSMQYLDSIFGSLLKPISRRQFDKSVERHDGDSYDKTFDSFSHLVALVYAQLGDVRSLRGLEAAWNAHSHHHYHLGVGALARSTVSDANARRPVAIFAETFAQLSGLADRVLRREGAQMLRLRCASSATLGAGSPSSPTTLSVPLSRSRRFTRLAGRSSCSSVGSNSTSQSADFSAAPRTPFVCSSSPP